MQKGNGIGSRTLQNCQYWRSGVKHAPTDFSSILSVMQLSATISGLQLERVQAFFDCLYRVRKPSGVDG